MARITAGPGSDRHGPPDAKTDAEGFRAYFWPLSDGTAQRVNSVTSIFSLVGKPHPLVNWLINKVVDRGLTTDHLVRLQNVYPVNATEGFDAPDPGGLAQLRKWLRDASTEERDAAGELGKQIHRALEMEWTLEQCNTQTRPYVAQAKHALANRNAVIIASEFQCWNLAVGYAGSADTLFWLLPEGVDRDYWQAEADAKRVTLAVVKAVGGDLELGDFKTGKSVRLSHILQITAYMAGEFVGTNGVIDERLTELLHATNVGSILHLKPRSWQWSPVPLLPEVLGAFFGAVAYARFQAAYKKPDALFSRTVTGRAPA